MTTSPSESSANEGMNENPNQHVLASISMMVVLKKTSLNTLSTQTKLDSHENMVVLGKNCFVFDRVQGQTCEVEPFESTVGTVKKIPTFDAAI